MDERWTINELRRLAEAALAATEYGGQESGRVRETPDQRTIRYYTTLGLLDRPAEMRGRTAYYGRRHVMQLAAIKRLQAKGMTLVQIQSALAGATDDRLTEWAGLPEDFWERNSPAAPAPPDPTALLASEPPPETGEKPASRSMSFWRDPPTLSPSPAPTKEGEVEPLAPRSAIVLPLADGVTLLLEGAAIESLDDPRLVELAPTATALVRDLRRLKLIP